MNYKSALQEFIGFLDRKMKKMQLKSFNSCSEHYKYAPHTEYTQKLLSSVCKALRPPGLKGPQFGTSQLKMYNMTACF